MKIGLITWKVDEKNYYAISRLKKSIQKFRARPIQIDLSNVLLGITSSLEFYNKSEKIDQIDVALARITARDFFVIDALKKLEAQKTIVINQAQVFEKAYDKFRTSLALKQAGLPIPKTYLTRSYEQAVEAIKKIGTPVVFKPTTGAGGQGVVKAQIFEDACSIAEILANIESPLYIQELIPTDRDIRTFVIGDEVISAIYRVAAKSWKTSISQGGRAELCPLTDELTNLSLKAAKAIGAEIAGIDLIESKDGYKILEVNTSPGFRGIIKATKINPSDAIVKYAISRAKK